MENNNTRTKRLVVVSNRLPIELQFQDNKISSKPGSGGLVTALAPLLKNRGGTWIGWPGFVPVADTELSSAMAEAGKSAGFSFVPVVLSKEEVELYYQGFSNEVIWPLFHDMQGMCRFNPDYWHAYESVNAKFANVICKQASASDFIWIHDFHLMRVADELRNRDVTAKLGFFLHIPFPPLDIFIKLPWRSQILNALLQFDLLGFQTPRDKRNFIHCVRTLMRDIQITSMRSTHICKTEQRDVRVGAFPISIDYKDFTTRASHEEIAKAAWLLHEKVPNQQIILSLDRLDYTKGIPERLDAIRVFLKKYPEFHKKVSFTQIIIPSRTDVPEYQALKKEIDRKIGEINSQFSIDNWIPIFYLFRSLTKTELLSYYRTSEVALVTPLKDGMNLVSKEYVACDIDKNGVLILSEFAGAAAQLYSGALLVNPYDIEGVADALHKALTMPKEERQRRSKLLRRIVQRYDIFWWMNMYLKTAFDLNLNDLPVLEEYVPTLSQNS